MAPDNAFEVTLLRGGDEPIAREMLAVFGRAFDELPTYTGHQPDDAWLRRLLAGETFVAIARHPRGRAAFRHFGI